MRAAAGRVRWSLVEGLIIAAILAAWLVVRLVVEVVITFVDLPFGGDFALVLGSVGDAMVGMVVPLALANVALYVAVRAGVVIVNRHAQQRE